MSKPAAYTEEQTRYWLWFLARNMQSHGQSMFMVEQLQPSWLLTKWQIFFYLLLSRTVMYGTLVMLVGCGIATFFPGNFGFNIAYSFLVFGSAIAAIGLIAGLLYAPVFFLRTSQSLPRWAKLSARFFSLLGEVTVLWLIVGPLEWALQRNGRSLNDDIQPVERISWSWMNFLKGLAFLTIEPPQWNSKPLLNRLLAIVFWTVRILWFGFLAVAGYLALAGTSGEDADRGPDITDVAFFLLPSLICAFFSAIRGRAVELKTKPNLGILLSGRNASITLAANSILILAAKLLASQFHRGSIEHAAVSVFFLVGMIVGAIAWGRLGGLDFLAHYCLRFVLRRCGYIPRDYVRFLNYAATELGFLQKVGGGYVFMHRYLLEYFASSEQSSSGAADFSTEGHAASN